MHQARSGDYITKSHPILTGLDLYSHCSLPPILVLPAMSIGTVLTLQSIAHLCASCNVYRICTHTAVYRPPLCFLQCLDLYSHCSLPPTLVLPAMSIGSVLTLQSTAHPCASCNVWICTHTAVYRPSLCFLQCLDLYSHCSLPPTLVLPAMSIGSLFQGKSKNFSGFTEQRITGRVQMSWRSDKVN
jgi:hypothetical protein